MLTAITVFFMQLVFIFLRTANIAAIASRSRLKMHITGAIQSLLFLTTTAYGVEAFNTMDPVVLTAWFAGGMIGAEIGFQRRRI